MSTTSGVFSETILQDVVLRASEIQFDNVIKNDYIPFADSLRALLDNQMARIGPLEVKDKDFTVKIWWTNACGLDIEDGRVCPDDCTELSTNAVEHHLDYEKHGCFSVDEKTFFNNYENAIDVIAKGLLREKKLLIEDFNLYVIGLLNTMMGVNGLVNGVGVPVGNTTYVPPVNWTANLMSYFWRVAKFNHLNNPFALSGANLYQAYLNATFGMNKDEIGNAFNTLKMYFDEINIDAVNSPDLITYLIDRGSYAAANKAYFPTVPEDINGVGKRWSEGLALFPGLVFDILQTYKCVDGFYYVSFDTVLKAGFFNNPSGCDSDDTGMLSFICGTAD